MITIRLRLSENTVAHLQEMAKPDSTVTMVCKELIENAVSDRRMRHRLALQMPAHHYTQRNADESWEAE